MTNYFKKLFCASSFFRMNPYYQLSIFVVSSSLLFGCHKNNDAQPSPTVTTLFNDNFANNNNGWDQFNVDSAYAQIQNDSFFIYNMTVGESYDLYKLIEVDTTKNFSIKSTITWKSGAINQAFGLIWGFGSQDYKTDKYQFLIFQNGQYLVDVERSGTYTYLTGVNRIISNTINAKSNVLQIQKIGKQYYFYINGSQVFTTTYYQPIFGYGMGIRVYSGLEVAVTNFNVSQW